jgi:2-dehydropantoate 2-reductase
VTITIVGAGAIGGTLGAYLTRAGEAVTLVDRVREHVDAMNAHGLRIVGVEEFTVPVRALTPEEIDEPLENVFLAVKSQHTAEAVRAIEPHLTPRGFIVSFQNGLCERTIAEIVGAKRTVGCFVNFSADYLEPGVIMYGSPGAVYLGELDGRMSPLIYGLREILSTWGEVKLTDNIWGYLWGKEAYGNMLFATALADETMADVIDRYRPLMIELASEIYAVAEREGVRVEPFDKLEPTLYYPPENRDPAAIHRTLDALTAWQRTSLKTKSGVWRDLAVRHRRTESGDLEEVVKIGASHGLAMPLTRRMLAMIHDIEEGRRTMSWDNLEELDALRRSLNLPCGLDQQNAQSI